MDIPDETIEQAIDAAYSVVDGEEPAGTWGDVRMTVGAAAPIIARSAQVAVLRELSEDLLAQRDRLRSGTDRYRNASRQYGLEEAAQMARSKANALEAGAGQTEVRDGE